MSIKKILQNYHIGMAAYDRCHPPTVTSQWQAFKSEVLEFIENPSNKEAWDILHSGGKVFWKLTGIPLQLMAWPTVCKHSQRYASCGCIRSPRNCEGRCCSQEIRCKKAIATPRQQPIRICKELHPNLECNGKSNIWGWLFLGRGGSIS